MSGAPILVFGAPFCGTSLLAQMLGSHPDLAAMPELRLGLADEVDELLEIFAISQAPIGDGLRRAVAEHLTGGQHARGIAAADAWLEAQRGRTTAALLTDLAAAVAPRRLVIPDSEAALRPHELLRWQRLAPTATLVHSLRHPQLHGRVWSRWLSSQLFVPADYRDHAVSPAPAVVEPQIPWLRCNRNLERWWALQPHVRLRMETLEAAPQATLAALVMAVGAAAVPAAVLETMLEAGASPFAGLGPSDAPRGLEMEVLDPVLEGLQLPPVPPTLDDAVSWRADGRGLDPAVSADARAYGYAPDTAASPDRATLKP